MNAMQRMISGVTGMLILLIVLFPMNLAPPTEPEKASVYLLQMAATVFVIGTFFMYLARKSD